MLDASASWRDQQPALPAPHAGSRGKPGQPPASGASRQTGLPAPVETWDESPQQRSARLQHLAQLVKSGGYAVYSHRLAQALLEWDPHRGSPRKAMEGADRRRAYMRDYMRRRRAQLAA